MFCAFPVQAPSSSPERPAHQESALPASSVVEEKVIQRSVNRPHVPSMLFVVNVV